MGWVLYNSKKHGKLGGKQFRFAGWAHATKLANKSIEATWVKYNNITIQFDDVAHIRKEITEYTVDETAKVIRNLRVPGYSSYSLPYDMLELWEDTKDKDDAVTTIDYNSAKYVAVTSEMMLSKYDMYRIKTRTVLRDYYAVPQYGGKYLGGFTTNSMKLPITDQNGNVLSGVTESDLKKMRRGALSYAVDTKNKKVTLLGTGKSQFVLPYEYLEVQFNTDLYLKDRKKENQITDAKEEAKPVTQQIETQKEEPKMELQFNAKQIMDQNKDALLVAAKIEVGEVAVQQVTKIVKKQLPLMMKGYADLPIFEIVLANIVVMSIRQFCPDNKKAQVIADAMLLAAMQKQIKEFNIPKMVEEFTSNIDISSITKLTKDE